MVCFVSNVGIARTPSFKAVVVGIGAVIPYKLIACANPVVQYSNEYSITTMSDIVLHENVAVRTILHENGG